jgi:calcineurin-like phosphoesterase family protein
MNRVLKIKTNTDQKVWFVSDTHLFHNKSFVWEVRGHTSPEDHTNFVIGKINELVKEDDILFHLGDITLNCTEEQFEDTIKQIRCRSVYLLWGNHNSPSWKIYQREVAQSLKRLTQNYTSASVDGWHKEDEFEVYPFRYKNLVFLGNYVEVILNGQYIVLTHYPIHSWNNMNKGTWHLFGHMHCKNSPTNGRRLDVGWDGYKKPLSFEEVKEIMDIKEILSDGGHH